MQFAVEPFLSFSFFRSKKGKIWNNYSRSTWSSSCTLDVINKERERVYKTISFLSFSLPFFVLFFSSSFRSCHKTCYSIPTQTLWPYTYSSARLQNKKKSSQFFFLFCLIVGMRDFNAQKKCTCLKRRKRIIVRDGSSWRRERAAAGFECGCERAVGRFPTAANVCANQILNFPLFALAAIFGFLFEKERKGPLCAAQFLRVNQFPFSFCHCGRICV